MLLLYANKNLNSCLTLYTKNNSKCISDLSMKPKYMT